MKKYQEKGIHRIFVGTGDFYRFSSSLLRPQVKAVDEVPTGDEAVRDHEVLREMIQDLGVNEFVLKQAEENIDAVVEIERIRQDNSAFLEIQTYTEAGELLRSIEMPDRYHTKVYRKTCLRLDGAIIQMITRPEGTVFTVWK